MIVVHSTQNAVFAKHPKENFTLRKSLWNNITQSVIPWQKENGTFKGYCFNTVCFAWCLLFRIASGMASKCDRESGGLPPTKKTKGNASNQCVTCSMNAGKEPRI